MANPSFWYRPGKGPLVPLLVVQQVSGNLIRCRVTNTNHPWYKRGDQLDLEREEIITKTGKPVGEKRLTTAITIGEMVNA